MKRKITMLMGGIAGVALSAALIFQAAGIHAQEPASSQTTAQAEAGDIGANVPIYRCRRCGAPTGGCYWPLCQDCWKKCPDPNKSTGDASK